MKLARELIRHGATVYPVMTPSATRIIHPDAMEFATGHKPVVQLSGQTEHVSWCGLVQDPVDLLLISPCTANTISKIARGIDDTPVTTCATTAIGSRVPNLLVPAMHLSMYDHKIIQKNIEICKKHGVLFVDPFISGNKAKSPEILEIVETVIRTIGRKDFHNEKILIIVGATAEPLDDIRVLTNRSSGKTAVALSISAFERGADVELWYGYASQPIPSFIKCRRFETVKDLGGGRRFRGKLARHIIVYEADSSIVAGRLTLEHSSLARSLGFASHPLEWFAFVTCRERSHQSDPLPTVISIAETADTYSPGTGPERAEPATTG